MSIFGDLERLLADLYPYRVPVTLAGAAVIAAAAVLIARRGWHRPPLRWASANRLPAAVIGGASAVVVLSVGYYLLSPLWERTTLIEASPLDAVVATAPVDDPTATATAAVTTEAPSSPTAGATGSATPSSEVAASATAATGPRLFSRGVFQGADSFHFAEGDALIVETAPDQFVLRFENFSIRNGPDLFVYLSADPEQPSQDAIRLGGLKATDGAFNYEIPAGTDISTLTHAMVWCDQFAVLFANAALAP